MDDTGKQHPHDSDNETEAQPTGREATPPELETEPESLEQDRDSRAGEDALEPVRRMYSTQSDFRFPHWTIHPVGFAFSVLAVAFIAYQLVGGVATALRFGLDVGEHVQGMRMATVVYQWLFLVGPAVLMLYLQPWSFRQVFRLSAPRAMPVVAIVVSIIASQFFAQVYLDVQEHVLRHYLLPEILMSALDALEKMMTEMVSALLIMRSPAEALFVLLVVGITPALCEEALFRGTVLYSLERGLRARWALLLCGSLFALFHLNPVTFVPLAILGTWLSLMVWRGNSIWYAVIGHAVNNTIAVLALYALETDTLVPTSAPGAMPDLATLAIGVASLAVFFASVLWFWQLTRPKPVVPIY